VRIISLLSWFDEPLPALAACLTTLRTRAGVDHVVALDGRYALFPAEDDVSPPEQAYAIRMACEQLGMGCSIYVPDEPWPGEPEKRTELFARGLEVAEPGDWFIVMDADQVVLKAPADLHEQLAAAEEDAADVSFHDKAIAEASCLKDFPETFPMRIIFKAQEILVVGHHACYESGDGRSLWSARQDRPQVDGLNLTDSVLIDHRPQARPTERLLAKNVYYTQRDESRIEFSLCSCGEKATIQFQGRWRMWRGRFIGDVMAMCERCTNEQQRKDAIVLRAMGYDPNQGRIAEHYGRAPDR
jgi:hypothetical protein